MTGLTLTRQVAEFAAALRLDAIPASVRHKAKLHILDSIGCGIAGASSSLAQQVFEYLAIEHREGPCPVLGTALGFGPATAGFANSAAMNALDFDDGFEIAGRGMGHPGATIVAAAVSAAFTARVSGAALLEAVIAAYEINNRLIRAMQPSFARFREVYGVCQHQSVGAAIAYGRLAGLDAAGLENAIGHAATLANVPSLRKYNWDSRPLISLKDFNAPATEAGIRAVQLHAAGLVGARDVLGGESGFWRMLGSDQFDANGMIAGLGSERAPDWALPHNAFKSFPVCRWMHTALEAFAEVVAAHGLAANEIEQVTVHTSGGMAGDFMVYAPATMVDAQFSLPFAIAAQALGIPPGAAWYRAETLRRDDVLSFARRVVATVDRQIDALMTGPLRRPAARVTLQARGAAHASRLIELPSGSAESPIDDASVQAKFIANAAPVIGPALAEECLARLMQIESEPDAGYVAGLGIPPASDSRAHETSI
jgi:2-methylcitrate dehydratase PrpD